MGFSVSVVDPGEGRGGAGLLGVAPLTEGFFTDFQYLEIRNGCPMYLIVIPKL